jgi:two-component sensor histidine kinase
MSVMDVGPDRQSEPAGLRLLEGCEPDLGLGSLLEQAAGIGTWQFDPERRTIRLSDAAAALHGFRAGMTEDVEAWLTRLHPDDRAAAAAALLDASLGTPLRGEWRVTREGEPRWIEMRGGLLPGPPARVAGIQLDIGARKRREVLMRLELQEAEHRAKNALVAAQAIVRLTRAEDPRDFARAVDQRIAALGRAHARFSVADAEGGFPLARILEEEFAPYDAGRPLVMRGPAVRITPAAIQPVCMALHELATNAAKHGALSRQGGVITVSGRLRTDGVLVITWREAGGSAPIQAPERRGFGLALLDAVIRRQLGGVIRLGWRPGGLHAVIALPPGSARPSGEG